eukprot:COSAG01_NODE_562_length_15456_cov_24.731458_9_plen_219_part_00
MCRYIEGILTDCSSTLSPIRTGSPSRRVRKPGWMRIQLAFERTPSSRADSAVGSSSATVLWICRNSPEASLSSWNTAPKVAARRPCAIAYSDSLTSDSIASRRCNSARSPWSSCESAPASHACNFFAAVYWSAGRSVNRANRGRDGCRLWSDTVSSPDREAGCVGMNSQNTLASSLRAQTKPTTCSELEMNSSANWSPMHRAPRSIDRRRPARPSAAR